MFRTYVEGRYTQDRLGVETMDEDSVEKNARKCALILCDEILKTYDGYKSQDDAVYFIGEIDYWSEIKSVLINMD